MLYLKFARRMSRNKQSMPVPSIISDNTKLEGTIDSTGIVHIDGGFKGIINCEELVIGIRGKLEGEVKAEKLFIYGELKGKAVVDSLFIASSAKLKGDVTHSSIAIEPGAYIDGRCIRKETGASNVVQMPKKSKSA